MDDKDKILELINKAIEPRKMGVSEAIEFLRDIIDEIKITIVALDGDK
jgi:hypothetical protein